MSDDSTLSHLKLLPFLVNLGTLKISIYFKVWGSNYLSEPPLLAMERWGEI